MKAFSVKPGAKVWIYDEPVNMGCSFPRLLKITDETMHQKVVESGDLFLFMNKKKAYLKILYWSKGGYCIHAKKLIAGTFAVSSGGKITIGDMHRVLDQISFKRKAALKGLPQRAA